MTKAKRNISDMTGTVTKQGNGAHIMVPKEWIGKQVKVIPVGNIEQTSDIENKFVDKVVKEVGENMTKGKRKK